MPLDPWDIRLAFEHGQNVTEMPRTETHADVNTEEAIETAYDLQAGSYVRSMSNPEMLAHKRDYATALVAHLSGLTEPTSILEPGVGEATTLRLVLEALPPGIDAHGYDISWSRVAWGCRHLADHGHRATSLVVASLLHQPYADDSFDVVYTSHAMEPNGGRQDEILRELYRVTSRYLILLEPCWSSASPEGRARMERLGYVRDLPGRARALGMTVIDHAPFAHVMNSLNPTAITVIGKNTDAPPARPRLVCPRFRVPLLDRGRHLYAPESMRVYPKIDGIPCLRLNDGIIASAMDTVRAG